MGQNVESTWIDRRWKLRRNSIVCKILADDKYISRSAALRKANEIMRKRDSVARTKKGKKS